MGTIQTSKFLKHVSMIFNKLLLSRVGINYYQLCENYIIDYLSPMIQIDKKDVPLTM